MSNKPNKGEDLNVQQKMFCDLYMSKEYFGSGVHAYAKAYGKDLTIGNQYNAAKVEACKLLKHHKVKEYMKSLLNDMGFNDDNVNRHLLFVIEQNAELSPKVQGMKLYYQLKDQISPDNQVNITMNLNNNKDELDKDNG